MDDTNDPTVNVEPLRPSTEFKKDNETPTDESGDDHDDDNVTLINRLQLIRYLGNDHVSTDKGFKSLKQ